MTTPIPDVFDWMQIIANVKDINSARFIHRLVEMQRQVLDSQVAQLGELSKQLEGQIKRLEAEDKTNK